MSVIAWLSRGISAVGILLLIALLPWLSGRDPALALLRARSGEQEASAETLAAIRMTWGLDQGPFALLLQWVRGMLRGDAGVSWVSGKPVMAGMLHAGSVSLTLMFWSLLVAVAVILLLSLPALWRGVAGRQPVSGSAVAVLLTTLPEFLLATVLLLLFAVWQPWFSPYGWQSPRDMVLPALALGLPAGGYLGRLYAEAIGTAFSERWVITWRMAGVRRWAIIRAVLQRGLISLLPVLGQVIVALAGGAIAVEKVFAIPGIGRATLGAAIAQDLPALQCGILLLLLFAMSVSCACRLMQSLLAGRAMRSFSFSTPESTQQANPSYLLAGISLFLLVALLMAGLPRDPWMTAFTRLAAPDWGLPFGADAMGRDLLARVAHGTLHTCILALGVALICLVTGMIAGIYPGVFSGPMELANALPTTLAGMMVVALLGPGESGAVLAVVLIAWAPLAAHSTALAAEIRARPWLRLLPLSGIGPIRRDYFYILPALAGPLFRHAMLRVPGIALTLTSLGFLGLGAAPPSPEWGRILAEGMPYVERAWWGVLTPVIAMTLLALLAVSGASLTFRRSSK